jgi:di/tricarboxylate transporter
MTWDQLALFAILGATVAMFAWGRWRHDMVAMAALLACVLAGLVPGEAAFSGFGHPAVITVAGVLVLSRALQVSGAVDVLAQRFLPEQATPVVMIAALTGLTAALSAFMNNVGALALVMPVAIRAAGQIDLPPGRVLMPVAFGSILGGMTTLIGTPPNLIVSGYRQETLGAPYRMFDYTPVGLAVALAGVGFIALAGWRLVPARRRAGFEGFETGAYVTEALVPEGSSSAGRSIREIEDEVSATHLQILSLIRREVRLRAPRPGLTVQGGDILVLEAEPETLAASLSKLELLLPGTEPPDDEPEGEADDDARPAGDAPPPKDDQADPAALSRGMEDDAQLMEVVVAPSASLIGTTARGIRLRSRFNLSLLAISRAGVRSVGRLRRTPFEAGDVLLLHGVEEAVADFAAQYGCLPLARRSLRLTDRRRMWLSIAIMLAAVALAASGLLAPPVAFMAGVLAVMALRVMPLASVYDAIDWPVIVLLACLLPVAGAMLDTGAADVIADLLVTRIAQGAPLLSLVLILIVTMTLSDIMNNAATVAVMAPIGYGAAVALDANPDAFFMAVAIGGSCAFLTPIGHQNNTLILGPGGFRFGDYWRLGLPVEGVVLLIGVPMILLIWGL